MNSTPLTKLTLLLAVVVAIPATDGSAQTVRRVRDIDNAGITAQGRRPVGLVPIGDVAYFAASDDAAGTELWKTAGSVANRLKDIVPGPGSSGPMGFVNVGPLVFFSASSPDASGLSRRGLWKTNGTEAGTVLVKALDEVSQLAVVGDTLYFAATDPAALPTQGIELWKSDGTEDGTALVKDLLPGSESSHPLWLTNVAGTLFFSALGPSGLSTSSQELWKSDGTEAGTLVVASIPTGGPSNPSWLTALGNLVCFAASVPSAGEELWKSDGTSAGTSMVSDLMPGSTGSNPQLLTNLDGTLYFSAKGGFGGRELWTSGGTAFETRQRADTNPGAADGDPSEILSLDGAVYFVAYGPQKRLFVLSSFGGVGSVSETYDPAHLTVMGGALYFFDQGPYGTRQLRRLRPPDSFPELVDSQAFPEAGPLVQAQSTLYFAASEGAEVALWMSNGAAPATRVDLSTTDPVSASAFPAGGADVEGTFFFAANQGTSGRELWKTDGTEAGTVLVKDINPTGSSSPSFLTRFKNALFFVANDGVHGRELWKSDGTEAGTGLVSDIATGPLGSDPHHLLVVGDTLFFSARVFGSLEELWKSDGTEGGTVLVGPHAFLPGGLSDFTSFGNALYYVRSETFAHTLSRMDTTTGDTLDLATLSAKPEGLTAAEGGLYFSAPDALNHRVLWFANETGSFAMSSAGADPRDLVTVGQSVYYSAVSDNAGRELWKAEAFGIGGYSASMVADVVPGPVSSTPSPWFTAGGFLYFSAGTDLWRMDTAGLARSLVKPFRASASKPLGPSLTPLATAGGSVFFSADDGSSGTEVWQTDGTPSGTAALADIEPGLGGSDPTDPVLTADRIFFQAHGSGSGRELWALDVPTLSISDVTVSEAASVAEFTVTLSSPATGLVRATCTTADGSATEFTDYNSFCQPILFGPGEQSTTIQVSLINDDQPEPDETFFVDLSGVVGASLRKARGTANIVDDDTAPTLTVPATAGVGELIGVDVKNAPGNSTDWVGLYREGALDRDLLDWKYLNGLRTAPQQGMPTATVSFRMPYAPGTYNLRLFGNNTYSKLATSANVTVQESAPPTVQANQTSVPSGGPVQVTVQNGPGNRTDWLGLYATTASDTAYLDWNYLNGQKTSPTQGQPSAVVGFSMPLATGTYEFRLFRGGTYQRLATSPGITVVAGQTPALSVNATTVSPGGTIQVTVQNGPGNPTDWLGMFVSTATDRTYLDWRYLNGDRTPPAQGLPAATVSFRMPMTPGTYNFRLFLANGFTGLATSVNVVVQ